MFQFSLSADRVRQVWNFGLTLLALLSRLLDISWTSTTNGRSPPSPLKDAATGRFFQALSLVSMTNSSPSRSPLAPSARQPIISRAKAPPAQKKTDKGSTNAFGEIRAQVATTRFWVRLIHPRTGVALLLLLGSTFPERLSSSRKQQPLCIGILVVHYRETKKTWSGCSKTTYIWGDILSYSCEKLRKPCPHPPRVYRS